MMKEELLKLTKLNNGHFLKGLKKGVAIALTGTTLMTTNLGCVNPNGPEKNPDDGNQTEIVDPNPSKPGNEGEKPGNEQPGDEQPTTPDIEREMREYDAGIDQYLFPIHRFAKTDDNMVGAPEERVKTGTPKERFEHAGRLTDKLLKDLSDQLAKDPVAADQLKPMIDELISKDYYHSSIQNIDPVIDGYRTAVTKMFAQVESLMDQDTRAKFNGVRQVYEWDVYRESLNWHKDDDSIPANNPDEKFILLDTLKLSFDKETALTLFKNPKMSQEEMHNILSETAAANGMQTASLVNLFSTGANIYAGAAGLRDSFGAGVVTKNGRYYPDGSFEKYADAFHVDVLTNNIITELAKTRNIMLDQSMER